MPLRAVLAALTLLVATTARAELELPISLETSRVSIHAEAGLEAQAARLAKRADEDLARIESQLAGLPRAERIDVRVVKHMESLAEAAPPGYGAPEWAAGVAYPRVGVVVVAVRDRNGGFLDLESTFSHELAHVALERALGNGVPRRWLTEGFAYLHSSDFSLARTQTLFGAVVGRRLMPLWQLEDSFPAREDAASLAYAQSYDFVVFLVRRGRHQDPQDDGDSAPFRRFLHELAAGKSYDAAAMDAYGRTLAQLEGEWLAGIRDRYLWMPVGLGSAALWALAALLVVLGWMRKRRQRRERLRQWEIEEALEDAAAAEAAAAALPVEDGRLMN